MFLIPPVKCIPVLFLITLAGSIPTFVRAQEPAPTTQDGTSAASPEAQFADARKLMQQGHYDEGLARLQEIEAKQPDLKGLAHELGIAFYKKADYLKAVEFLKKAQQEDPKDAEAVQLTGLSYYLAGRPADAIPLLERVQGWYPSANVDASYVLGICYIQTKNYPGARTAFAKMYGVPPDSAASYLFTARMLLRQDFEPPAEEYAREAAKIDPKLPLVHYLLGELYLFQSKIPEAITEFQTELEINPGYAGVYYKLADADSRIEKYEDAEKLLQRSIWLDPTSSGP
jgi:tetratricopeptide (TPR) repeat protein